MFKAAIAKAKHDRREFKKMSKASQSAVNHSEAVTEGAGAASNDVSVVSSNSKLYICAGFHFNANHISCSSY